MTRAVLDVHGVRIALTSNEPEALEGLLAQFLGFETDADGGAVVRVELRRTEDVGVGGARLVADQIVERGIVYNRGDTVIVDHHGRACSSYDYAQEEGLVRAREPADLIELAYLMIHSRLGPLLEARGFTRIHACGFVVDGKAGLVLTPSGGGKSRLALALLGVGSEVTLLGDDMVLLDEAGRAHPFPHPIGVSDPSLAAHLHGEVRRFQRRAYEDKFLVGGDAVLARHARSPHPVALIALATRTSAPPTRVVPAERGDVSVALWRDTVVGLGLPQVLEMVARRGGRDLVRMTPSILRRARRAFVLLRKAQAVRLESYDPQEAANLLVESLRARGGR